MNALLLSLPGTPVIYYGDEIGMGDNIYLGDRNGVRTPMQWSGDRNAGFSRANPQRLYLPVIIDPEYHYEAVNVETQQGNSQSLLWWIKRLIALRKLSHALGEGSMEFLLPENRKVLAFLRRSGEERVLVVANLSRFSQYVELDLVGVRGHDAGGDVRPHSLPADRDPPLPADPRAVRIPLAVAACPEAGARRRRAAGRAAPGRRGGRRLAERRARAATGAPWRRRSRPTCPLGPGSPAARQPHRRRHHRRCRPAPDVPGPRPPAARARGVRGQRARGVPAGPGPRDGRRRRAHPERSSRSRDRPSDRAPTATRPTRDCCTTRASTRRSRSSWSTRSADAAGTAASGGSSPRRPSRDFARLIEAGPLPEPTVLRLSRSNTSMVFGDRLYLKLLRRVEEGVDPDLELARVLAARGIRGGAAGAGTVEYRRERGVTATLALLEHYVQNEGDAWRYTIDTLERFFERVLAGQVGENGLPPADRLPARRRGGPAARHRRRRRGLLSARGAAPRRAHRRDAPRPRRRRPGPRLRARTLHARSTSGRCTRRRGPRPGRR